MGHGFLSLFPALLLPVILYSPDGGQNWSVIYQNKEIAKLNSIQIFDETKVIAVGDKGLIIKSLISSIIR